MIWSIVLALHIFGWHIGIPLLGESGALFALFIGQLQEYLRQCRGILTDVFSITSAGKATLNFRHAIRVYAPTYRLLGP